MADYTAEEIQEALYKLKAEKEKNALKEDVLTKKNCALEVCNHLFKQRTIGLITIFSAFGVYIATIFPRAKMIITGIIIVLGLYGLVTAQQKLTMLNNKYDLKLNTSLQLGGNNLGRKK